MAVGPLEIMIAGAPEIGGIQTPPFLHQYTNHGSFFWGWWQGDFDLRTTGER